MHDLVSAGGDRRFAAGFLAAACLGLSLVVSAPAHAAAPHVVQPGESLWSIAAANNFTTRTVAAFNGLDENATVIAGQTIQVPTVEEGAAALASAGVATSTTSAGATSGASHTVQPGESLSSVASANGTTIDALAAANGLSPDSFLIIGQAITIPTASGTTATSSTDTYWLGHIPSAWGELHLDPAAADSWNAMRAEALAGYGVDLAPAGPLSAYRTYDEQAQLYQQFLDGTGAPANPPGTSSHELGVAVDLGDPAMREVIDQIGGAYGWAGTIPSEWWHVAYVG